MFELCKAWKEGRLNIYNELYKASTGTAINDSMIIGMNMFIQDNRRIIVTDQNSFLNISFFLNKKILISTKEGGIKTSQKWGTPSARQCVRLLPHRVKVRMHTLTELAWDVVQHLRHSLDISECEYHVLGPFKFFRAGRKFDQIEKWKILP